MKKTVYILLCIFLTSNLFAQSDVETLEQLGIQFYQDEKYELAAETFEKLIRKSDQYVHFEYLMLSYVQLKEFSKAEKLIKKKIKRDELNPVYHIDYGYVYLQQDESKKADKAFDEAIDLLVADNQQIIAVASHFLKRKQPKAAIQTYLKGRKLVKESYPFSFELAEIYHAQGNYKEMVDEYLFVLEYGESYIEAVQNALLTSVGEESEAKKTILKEALLKKIQSNPDEEMYADLLIWFYIQEQNFEGALIQAKALDRRKKMQGEKVNQLAQLAYKNENYRVAIKAYKYIINKGHESVYYRRAKMDLVKVLNQKITTDPNYTQQDLNDLKAAYESTLDELGKNTFTINLVRGYAHLLAFYFHDIDEAMKLLQFSIDIPRLIKKQVAECKMELADVLVLKNEIWDASLLYSQVDKDFKHDILGQEARYRNARVSYYAGDFQWAKSQLDVLKSASDKLIANDAMNLSILISDNLAMDSTDTHLKTFARAQLLAYQNKDSLALYSLDSIEIHFKSHFSIMDDVMFLRAQIYKKKHDWEKVAMYLQKTYEYKDLLADDALFQLAELYHYTLDQPDLAQEKYQEILFNFTGSVYVEEARKRYRTLRGDQNF